MRLCKACCGTPVEYTSAIGFDCKYLPRGKKLPLSHVVLGQLTNPICFELCDLQSELLSKLEDWLESDSKFT